MSIDALATQIKRLAGSRRRPTFFSAAGVNRRELPQSDFLRFLLDPSEKHGLGDAFLKRFLQRSLAWNIHRQFSEELDFIASHPPMSQVHQQVESMIRETASQKKEIEWEDSERDNICFILPEWHRRPPTADLPKQTGYRSFLLFWFEDFEDSVTLYFGVADQSPFLREKMTQMLSASEKGWGQQHAVVHTSDGWNQIWSRRFLGSFDEIRHLEREEVFNRLQDRWNWFLEKDLPKFRRGIALALSGVL